MTTIRITGWRPGLRKVSLTRLLQQYAGFSLIEAKGGVDAVLEGSSLTIVFLTREIAEEFMQKATEMGAIVEIEEE